MRKRFLFWLLPGAFMASCNNESANKQSTPGDSSANNSATQPATAEHEQQSSLPTSVIFRNWEQGDPQNSQIIFDAYKAWDSDSTGPLASYFGDTTRFDLPDGRRLTTTNSTIESLLRKWRRNYKETVNIPFSLISLHNKDREQQWVIAWTWNKWRNADGSRDSMLYCDNWRLKDHKIVYLNSTENLPSKPLLKTLNKIPSK